MQANEILFKKMTETAPKTHHNRSRNHFISGDHDPAPPLEYVLTLSFIWALTAMKGVRRVLLSHKIPYYKSYFKHTSIQIDQNAI